MHSLTITFLIITAIFLLAACIFAQKKNYPAAGNFITAFVMVGLMAFLSFMRYDSWEFFPSPSQRQPCGLVIPEGHHHNRSAEYFFRGEWIWVELKDPEPEEVEEGHWKFNKECKRILEYDIVRQRWAEPCAQWCDEQWGSFTFNEACAFGTMRNENDKDMPVLRACQKAVFAKHYGIPDWVCWLIGLTAVTAGIILGCLRTRPEGFAKFASADTEDATLAVPLCCIHCCVPIKRRTAQRFSILKMGASLLVDVFTDLTGGLLYFAHGQPFFCAYQLFTLATTFVGDDILGTQSIMWWLWSMDYGIPAKALLDRKAKETAEGTATLVVLMLFFLITPVRDDEGQAVLSWFSIVNFLVSLAFTYLGIYDGAEAKAKVAMLNFDPKLEQDFDKQYQLFKEHSTSITLFSVSLTVQKVAYGGTVAVMVKQGLFVEASGLAAAGTLAALVLAGVFWIIAWCASGNKMNLGAFFDIVSSFSETFACISSIFAWWQMRSTEGFQSMPWELQGMPDLQIAAVSMVQVLSLRLTCACLLLSPFVSAWRVADVVLKFNQVTQYQPLLS